MGRVQRGEAGGPGGKSRGTLSLLAEVGEARWVQKLGGQRTALETEI